MHLLKGFFYVDRIRKRHTSKVFGNHDTVETGDKNMHNQSENFIFMQFGVAFIRFSYYNHIQNSTINDFIKNL